MSAVVIGIEIIALLACAAFFSGAETAVTALTRADYRSLKKSSRKSAQRLARLVELKDKIVTAALIGTNFVNTLNSGLITAFTLNVFGAQAVPAATAGITVLIIILAEIFPKALAAERRESIGKAASLPLYLCYLLLRPLVAVFSLLTRAVPQQPLFPAARLRFYNQDDHRNCALQKPVVCFAGTATAGTDLVVASSPVYPGRRADLFGYQSDECQPPEHGDHHRRARRHRRPYHNGRYCCRGVQYHAG